MSDQPLLMIPGPIELSPAVREAAAAAPPSHTAPDLVSTFGRALRAMRTVWHAGPDSQPYVVAGSGTLAMEMAVWNLVDPGQPVLVVNAGYFGDRMATMLERRGAIVRQVVAAPGEVVSPAQVADALAQSSAHAVFVTHVDTSTGVRQDAAGIASVARAHDALVVVDGVCSTVGEALDQAACGVDLFLTGSQKAIGAPPGLALLVTSPRAEQARRNLVSPPPLGLDLDAFRPVMEAYEEGRPSYFATPATSLVRSLDVALAEILERGVPAVWAQHARTADSLRAAWRVLGLELIPAPDVAANTLSALRYPDGVGPSLVGEIGARGVSVAGGLHPALKASSFRVGHMGWVTGQPALLERTVRAIGEALVAQGHPCSPDEAVATLHATVA